jgi:hypothetical protein
VTSASVYCAGYAGFFDNFDSDEIYDAFLILSLLNRELGVSIFVSKWKKLCQKRKQIRL